MDRCRPAAVDLRLHLALRRLLRVGLVLVGVLGVSAGCWMWLQAVGDGGAADGARGVAAVTLFALVLDVLGLVGLLASLELRRQKTPADVPTHGGVGSDNQGR